MPIRIDDGIQTKCEQILLNTKHKLFLHRFYELEKKTHQRYLINLIITVNNTEQVTENFAETIQFKEELNLFFRGDIQNTFLQIASKADVRSLSLEMPEGIKIYISQSEAIAIASLIHYAMQGFLFVKLFDKDLTKAYGLDELDSIRQSS